MPMPRIFLATATLIILALAFVGGDRFIRHRLVLPGFIELERSEAAKDITRCLTTLQREIDHVQRLSTDWASWDDLYDYVFDGNQAFVDSNFQWNTLLKTDIHLMYVIDSEGRIVYGETRLPGSGEVAPMTTLPSGSFPPNHHLLIVPANLTSRAGVHLTEHGPMLLAIHRILTSEGRGPSRGTLLLGRFLDHELLEELRRQTQISFSVRDRLTAPLTEDNLRRIDSLATARYLTENVDEHTLHAYGLLPGLDGQPALLITAELPRRIMARGQETARFASLVVLVAVGAILLSTLVPFLMLRKRSRRRQEEIEALVQLRTDQLRLSEERLHALADASFEAVFISENGILLEQNRAAETLFGYDAVEAAGRYLITLVAPDDRPLLKRRELGGEGDALELRGLRKNGHIFPVEVQSRHATYRGREVRVDAFRDLSRQKDEERQRALMEEKLHRAQKMESIGMMAGGVAHDLNNILSGVISYPELLLMQIPADSPMVKPLEAIKASGKSAAAVVDDLLTLARGLAATRSIDNIEAIIDDYLRSPEFVKLKEIHGEVEFLRVAEPQLLNVACSPIHIRKCLMNLVTNAAEAIVGEGRVTIASRNVYLERPLPGHPEMRQGEYAVLTVSDTGTGIPEESLQRIFEPFFSRKVVGRSGTGLGLAMIWSIVNDHGGGLTVASDAGGTTFELYFPATREEMATDDDATGFDRLRGRGERILVVDDDYGQRTIATELLGSLGYHCHAVASGEEALVYLESNRADLVILDMVMPPGINGAETFRRIIAANPGQLAIISSGFADSDDLQRALADGVRRFVQKPYLVKTLASAVQDTLAGR